MTNQPLDLIWQNIRNEAQELANSEPMLASFFH
ncbi:serine O-acetyltransferase, partial [Glaesserella parasuis]|nr:serine O-acetyltransferase [Glaesserella parasuis]MDE3989846.1 serine O-acetyltransferase [Glaesserella parasuis]